VAIKVKADAATAALAKKMGYNVTNKDGEPLYCRTDRITGTHIGTQTTCLTARQLYAQQEQMRRDMSSTMQNIPGAAQR
jgi:hypothetical protein